MRTEVGIVGAGPAGLMLSHLLARVGIDSVVIEDRSRAHVEARIRAGVLERPTVELLHEVGLGARLGREGMEHEGIELHFGGAAHRIDFRRLTGSAITVYGQHEVVKDLIAARLAAGGRIEFGVADVRLAGLDGRDPMISWRRADGGQVELRCDFVAGCDGFHGICRNAVPAGVLTVFDRIWPFAWLGILAEAPPAAEELIYAHHAEGFALLSMRSPQISRHYLQCAPDEDLSRWPGDRVFDELARRAAVPVPEGPVLQKSVTAMRSFVVEPMQYGRLFLAGDAAHIVPPTGAKGMNLAIADVRWLAEALAAFYADGSERLLAGYSERCLRRVWNAQRFSAWMTALLHVDPDATRFDLRRQRAELDYLVGSQAAMSSLAENYVGLPFA